MTRLRIRMKSGGISGYWVVQEKHLFFWRKVAEFSIWVYGSKTAYLMAVETLKIYYESELTK